MRITTLTELATYLRGAYGPGIRWTDKPLYVASHNQGYIEEHIFNHEPIIGYGGGFSCLQVNPPKVEDLFVFYMSSDNNYIHNFSLLDSNIPLNNYNDHIIFTTREEAKEYIMPNHIRHAKIGRDMMIGIVPNIDVFENNIRNYAVANKINCIKLIRSIANMDLVTAKYYVESVAKNDPDAELKLGDILKKAMKN